MKTISKILLASPFIVLFCIFVWYTSSDTIKNVLFHDTNTHSIDVNKVNELECGYYRLKSALYIGTNDTITIKGALKDGYICTNLLIFSEIGIINNGHVNIENLNVTSIGNNTFIVNMKNGIVDAKNMKYFEYKGEPNDVI